MLEDLDRRSTQSSLDKNICFNNIFCVYASSFVVINSHLTDTMSFSNRFYITLSVSLKYKPLPWCVTFFVIAGIEGLSKISLHKTLVRIYHSGITIFLWLNCGTSHSSEVNLHYAKFPLLKFSSLKWLSIQNRLSSAYGSIRLVL